MSESRQMTHPSDTGLLACLTIDDVSAGDGVRVRRLLDWLDEQQVRASFFVIPFSVGNQAPLTEDAELVTALHEAAEAGHEFHPHGYDHELFECGLPDLMCIHDEQMMQRIARTLSREEFQLRHTHTRGMIGARISRSLRIMQAVFDGYRPAGFRSGYHEFCREMYFALETCQVRWSSSRTAVPNALARQVTSEADEIVSWVGLLPYWVGNVLEIPHLADYGSHIAPHEKSAWVDLARRHLAMCEDAKAPFVATAHQPGLACAGDPADWRQTGYAAYREVIAVARDEFNAEFVTMGEIAERALATPHYWAQRDEYRR